MTFDELHTKYLFLSNEIPNNTGVIVSPIVYKTVSLGSVGCKLEIDKEKSKQNLIRFIKEIQEKYLILLL